MPRISPKEAMEKLAQAVEAASPGYLVWIYAELYPEKDRISPETARSLLGEMTSYIRNELEIDELLDLWHIVFPKDRNVYYDEVDEVISYNQEKPWYVG
jgi:hypothetical protein